jgi:toxin ParE1/3/4
MPPVIRSEQAEQDVADILAYLGERNPDAADRLAEAIDARCARIANFPEIGRSRDDLAPGLRSVVIDRYVLFYRASEEAISMVRVLHGARDIDRIMRASDPE